MNERNLDRLNKLVNQISIDTFNFIYEVLGEYEFHYIISYLVYYGFMSFLLYTSHAFRFFSYFIRKYINEVTKLFYLVNLTIHYRTNVMANTI